MIFVDTGAWFAQAVRVDINHVAAIRWFTANQEPLLTTDYVVDETLTLLRSRRQNPAALALGRQFFSGQLATIYYLTPADIRAAWQTFEQFADKEWSFTDCSSKVVMGQLGLAQAFAFDQHFQQFGTVQVVP